MFKSELVEESMDDNDNKYLQIKLDKTQKHPHYVSIRPHFSLKKVADKPAGRTLEVSNIPPYINEASIKVAFARAGKIEDVIFMENTSHSNEVQEKKDNESYFNPPQHMNKFKTAYIVFEAAKSLQTALELKQLTWVNTNNNTLLVGKDRWWAEYLARIPDKNKLQAEIDAYVQQYDAQQEEAKNLEEEDDGWTKVKAGSKQGFEQKESVITKLEDKMQKSKKRKTLNDFYTFQVRDANLSKIVSLRKKYQADQGQLEAMKYKKKFKSK